MTVAVGTRVRVTGSAFPVIAPPGTIGIVERLSTANTPAVLWYEVRVAAGLLVGLYMNEFVPVAEQVPDSLRGGA